MRIELIHKVKLTKPTKRIVRILVATISTPIPVEVTDSNKTNSSGITYYCNGDVFEVIDITVYDLSPSATELENKWHQVAQMKSTPKPSNKTNNVICPHTRPKNAVHFSSASFLDESEDEERTKSTA